MGLHVIASRLSGDRKARVDDGMQTIHGVGLLIVLLNVIGIAVAAAFLTIQRPCKGLAAPAFQGARNVVRRILGV